MSSSARSRAGMSGRRVAVMGRRGYTSSDPGPCAALGRRGLAARRPARSSGAGARRLAAGRRGRLARASRSSVMLPPANAGYRADTGRRVTRGRARIVRDHARTSPRRGPTPGPRPTLWPRFAWSMLLGAAWAATTGRRRRRLGRATGTTDRRGPSGVAAGRACPRPGSGGTSRSTMRRFSTRRNGVPERVSSWVSSGTRSRRTGRRCERSTVNSASAWAIVVRMSRSACWMRSGVRIRSA